MESEINRPSLSDKDLRDEFAIAAMMGIWSSDFVEVARKSAEDDECTITETIARAAYEQADAMLKARKQ